MYDLPRTAYSRLNYCPPTADTCSVTCVAHLNTYIRATTYVRPRTYLPTRVHGLQVEAVTKGDASVYCIAAASIIAKVGPTG